MATSFEDAVKLIEHAKSAWDVKPYVTELVQGLQDAARRLPALEARVAKLEAVAKTHSGEVS